MTTTFKFEVNQKVLHKNPFGRDVKDGMILTITARNVDEKYGTYYWTGEQSGRFYEQCLHFIN